MLVCHLPSWCKKHSLTAMSSYTVSVSAVFACSIHATSTLIICWLEYYGTYQLLVVTNQHKRALGEQVNLATHSALQNHNAYPFPSNSGRVKFPILDTYLPWNPGRPIHLRGSVKVEDMLIREMGNASICVTVAASCRREVGVYFRSEKLQVFLKSRGKNEKITHVEGFLGSNSQICIFLPAKKNRDNETVLCAAVLWWVVGNRNTFICSSWITCMYSFRAGEGV